ncbi:type II secretion system protein GspM [Thalassococcus sp. BH17M4-6]|uniref:type II secretion system protein GspM n=1 Tax=Thalassococcus sp. BH17M4-6 TaxID=3413148 RepID=UPI003BEA404A
MNAFSKLSRREQIMLLGGGALLLALALWRFGWQPIQTEQALLQEDMARYMTLMRVADQAGQGPDDTAAADPRPIALRITQTAEAQGLSLTRLEPEGAGMRVAMDVADFARIIDWIAVLEANANLRATTVELDRRPTPGEVSARLTLEPAT